MIRNFLIFLLLALSKTLVAQDDYRDTTKLEMPEHMNEVFLNLNPVAVVLMGGESIQPRISVGYRRQLQENSALRIWINAESIENFAEYDKIVSVGVNNPSYQLRRVNEQTENRIDLRAGMQWFKPDRKISSVYGLDVFGGIQRREEIKEYRTFDLDTALCPTCFSPSLLIPDEINTYEVTYLVAGFDFSIGALFKASDRIWLILQWTPEIYYLSILNEKQSGKPPLVFGQSGLNFSFRGVELFGGLRF